MEIKKQELKQILTDQRKEYERFLTGERKEYEHFLGALKEDFYSKVELIGEQYFDIKKILTSHTEMIASTKEDVEIMKVDVASTKEDIEIMKIDVAFIKGELQQKVDIEQFTALERRVALLESKSR